MAGEVKPPAFLRALGHTLERDSGGWFAACPHIAHGGFDLLVYADDKAGRFVLDCLEGCDEHTVLRAAELTLEDLRIPVSGGGLIAYSALTVEHVEWVVPGHIPAGMLTVLAGEQGLGKSLLHARWASELSKHDLSSVLISAEDSPTHTTKARLIAADANQDLVYHAEILPVLGNGDDPRWMNTLAKWIETTAARLVVFDPMMAFIDAASDSYKAQHVRRILASLDTLAYTTNTAIVYVMHLTKAEGAQPLKRIAGAGAWTEAARSVLLMTPKDGDPYQPHRVLGHVKCNVAEKAIAQLWEVEAILIPALQGKDVKTARITYRGEDASIDMQRVLLPRETDDDASERTQARELILSYLSGGPVPSSDLERVVRESGISSRTYDAARRDVGVYAFQQNRRWFTKLSVTSQDANGQDANGGLRPDDGLTMRSEGSESRQDANTGSVRPEPDRLSQTPVDDWPW